MQARDAAEVIRRFNQAFEGHDPAIPEDLVASDCVMESIQPAPNGTRYEGYDVSLAFWQAMAADRVNRLEETFVMGDRANIRWRFHFGDGGKNEKTSETHKDRCLSSFNRNLVHHRPLGRDLRRLHRSMR